MANDKNLKPVKTGEVRNPNGRPKGSKNRSTIARQILSMKTTLPEKAHAQLLAIFPQMKQKLTVEEVITLIQAAKAIGQKDTVAYKALLDSAYGTSVSLEMEKTEDITVNVTF